MTDQLCLRLEAVGALVRERMPAWSGYRGQGRRPEFVDRVVSLAIFLARHNHARPGGLFPIARMALERVMGLGNHLVRSALKCLVELGLVSVASPLERRGRFLGMTPGAKSVWFKARLFSLASVVREIFVDPDAQQSVNQTRPKTPPTSQGKAQGSKGIPHGVQFLATCRPAPPAPDVVRSQERAFLRSLFRGSDDAFEAMWRAQPDARRRSAAAG